MIARASKSKLAFCLVFGSVGFFSSAEAQTPRGAQSANTDYQSPTTEWGHPDIQGNWSNATLTTFERRPGLGPVYTPAEVKEWESASTSFIASALREGKVLYERQ